MFCGWGRNGRLEIQGTCVSLSSGFSDKGHISWLFEPHPILNVLNILKLSWKSPPEVVACHGVGGVWASLWWYRRAAISVKSYNLKFALTAVEILFTSCKWPQESEFYRYSETKAKYGKSERMLRWKYDWSCLSKFSFTNSQI